MRLTCPACGAVASLEIWSQDGKARETLATVAAMPGEVASHACAYLSLFRPKSKALTWTRALKIANELKSMVEHGWVRWDRSVDRPATPDMWAAAMARMIECPPRDLPLSNHNYLRRIVFSMADEADRHAEVSRNKTERAGTFRKDAGTGISPIGECKPPSVEEMKRIRAESKKRIKAKLAGNEVQDG